MKKDKFKAVKAFLTASAAGLSLVGCVTTVQQPTPEPTTINIPGAPTRSQLGNTDTLLVIPAQPFEDQSRYLLFNQLRRDCLREFNQHRIDSNYRYDPQCNTFVQDPYYRNNFDRCYNAHDGWEMRCSPNDRHRNPPPRSYTPYRSHNY